MTIIWTLVAVIIVALLVRRVIVSAREAGGAVDPTLDDHPPEMDAQSIAAVSGYVATDLKIHAVKAVRSATGRGLRDAVHIVESWDPLRHGAQEEPTIDDEARAIRALEGRSSAINHLRRRTGCDRTSARSRLDALE